MVVKLFDRYVCAPCQQSYFLFGPRGAGKTSWLKRTYGDEALYLDLSDPEIACFYLSNPERLNDTAAANPSDVIIVDEVQRVPKLLAVVREFIKRNKSLQFVLAGSNPRPLKRFGLEPLEQIMSWQTMSPFWARELGPKFKLSDALETGLLPVVRGSDHPVGALRGYMGQYIRDEVRAENMVRDVGKFSRFIEVVCRSHGRLLNLAKIGRESGLMHKAVSIYLDLLSELSLAFTVPVFAPEAKRRVSRFPKFYLFDTGVFRSLQSRTPIEPTAEVEALALEGLVAQHLRAWVERNNHRDELYFWRTPKGRTVDFVLHGDRGTVAVEVGNTNIIRYDDLSGIKAFVTDYPKARGFYLYRGTQKCVIDNVLCWPCEEFLLQIAPDTDFSALR